MAGILTFFLAAAGMFGGMFAFASLYDPHRPDLLCRVDTPKERLWLPCECPPAKQVKGECK